MARHVSPTVGSWYRDLQSGSVFEVVAWDTGQQTIETQLIDGELSEFDVDAWSLMVLERIEEPEDWRNPYEMDGEDAIDPKSQAGLQLRHRPADSGQHPAPGPGGAGGGYLATRVPRLQPGLGGIPIRPSKGTPVV